jgi:hypothetical protein
MHFFQAQLDIASNDNGGDGLHAKLEFMFLGWDAGDDISISIRVNRVRFELFVSRNAGWLNSPKALGDFNKYFAVISASGLGCRYAATRMMMLNNTSDQLPRHYPQR